MSLDLPGLSLGDLAQSWSLTCHGHDPHRFFAEVAIGIHLASKSTSATAAYRYGKPLLVFA